MLVKHTNAETKKYNEENEYAEYAEYAEYSVKHLKLINRLILNSTVEGILGLDTQNRISFINPAAEKLLILREDKVLGMPLCQVLRHSLIEGKEYTIKTSPLLNVIRSKKPYSGSEELFYKSNGDGFLVEYRCSPILDEANALGAIITFNDITENIRMREGQNEMAQIDDLTGLYNRRGYILKSHQHLLMANLVGKALFVVYIDLDGMKEINDTYGHQAGDLALKDLTAILKNVFRDSDVIARLGGDEFAVSAIADPSDSFSEVIETRLFENLDEHNATNTRPYELSFSVGIVYSRANSRVPLTSLLKQADELMYIQKSAKKAPTTST